MEKPDEMCIRDSLGAVPEFSEHNFVAGKEIKQKYGEQNNALKDIGYRSTEAQDLSLIHISCG